MAWWRSWWGPRSRPALWQPECGCRACSCGTDSCCGLWGGSTCSPLDLFRTSELNQLVRRDILTALTPSTSQTYRTHTHTQLGSCTCAQNLDHTHTHKYIYKRLQHKWGDKHKRMANDFTQTQWETRSPYKQPTHTQTHTRSHEVGSDSRRLMQLSEMIWVLKVLNTIILFYPSLYLLLSSH